MQTVPGEKGPDLGKRDTEQALEAMGLELDCTLDTAVDNLLDLGLLCAYEPDGPEWYIIRERDGEFVMGEKKFPAAVQEECSRAIEHIRSMDAPDDEDGAPAVADGGDPIQTNDEGETLREEVASELEIEPGEMEDFLSVGTPQGRRQKLERLVEAIEDSETFAMPDSFDEIKLIHKGYRYHRSKSALSAY